MQSVYIETTIPSYLAAHPSSQQSIAVDQQATQAWWVQERLRFRLFTSAFTIDECSRGDTEAAARRLSFLELIPELSIPSDLNFIESDIIRLFQLPKKAYTDASHLALANYAPNGLLSDMELHSLGERRSPEGVGRVLRLPRASCADCLHTRNIDSAL